MTEKIEIGFMWEAYKLAQKGLGHTRPNPPVGAVVVRNDQIIGRGWHKRCGSDHAEVAAIKDALRKLKRIGNRERGIGVEGKPLSGCELYVTLEPCSKAGRVGACTDAIIAAGITRVVYAVADPNPKNRGKAKRALARHGIACIRATRRACDPRDWDACGGMKSFLDAARRLIAPFAKHVTTGMPYVTVKLAMSLDGKICDNWGDAKWISSARSRIVTGWERAEVDAIMVGAETIRKDNPSLLSHNRRNDDLVRVIVSKSGKLSKKAQVFTDGAPNETLVFRDARAALVELGKRGMMHVLCEGGLKLATSLADAGLVDRWIAVHSPTVIGSRHVKDALRFNLYSDGFSDPWIGDRIGEYECLRD